MEPTQDSDSIDTAILSIPRPMASARDRTRLHELIAQAIRHCRSRRLVVDFSQAGWFGVPILDELITTQHALAQEGGDLAIVSSSSRIARMFSAAHVDRVKLYSSVHSALSSFRNPVHVAA